MFLIADSLLEIADLRMAIDESANVWRPFSIATSVVLRVQTQLSSLCDQPRERIRGSADVEFRHTSAPAPFRGDTQILLGYFTVSY